MLAWTLQNLMLVGMLAPLVWLVCRLRSVGPALRHALWLVVLIKLITPPWFVWPWPIPDPLGSLARQLAPATANVHAWPSFVPEPNVATQQDWRRAEATHAAEPAMLADSLIAQPGQKEAPTASRTRTTHFRPRWIVSLPSLATLGAIIWVMGSAAFALLQAVRIGRTVSRVKTARPAEELLLRHVRRMTACLKLRPVPVHVVSGMGTPFIWAFPRPRLMWPAEAPAELSAAAMQGLVVHELAHVKRRDHWVGWLELAAGCLWWWNPLFWYIRHQLRENAELACDAWVVGTLPKGRRAYAEALLSVCECISKSAPPMPAMGVSRGSRQSFERRLTMIMQDRVGFRLSRGGLLAAVILAMTALPAWSQKPVEEFRVQIVEEQIQSLRLAQEAVGRAIRARSYLQPQNSLPRDAKLAIEQFETFQNHARREADRKIEQSRQELIRQLEALRIQYSKDGRTDEAAAVLAYLRNLSPTTEALADPQWLVDYRGRVGQSFLFDVVGSVEGTVWGTEVYTDDSQLSTAAVHAGVLQPGQRRTVRVTILDGQGSYAASTRNGIASSSYGSWEGSYRVEAAAAATAPTIFSVEGSGGAYNYRDRVGQTISFQIVGATGGSVWGTDIYTDDSDLATAAVHAGILQPGQQGLVHVNLLPGRGSYQASTRNGVTSLSYEEWEGSFRFVAARTTPWVRGTTRAISENLRDYRNQPELRITLTVTGSTNGTVWGTDVYTDDSPLAVAAVHAGLLQVGQTGTVDVMILPGYERYQGSSRNGVTSDDWGSWGGSYRIVSARPILRSWTSRALLAPSNRSIPLYPARPSDREPSRIGKSIAMELVGSTDGTVWGTDVYTDDSSIAAAAVHAGVLEVGERATITVTYSEGRESYTASTRNGVSSHDYGPWGGSFRVQRSNTSGKRIEIELRSVREE